MEQDSDSGSPTVKSLPIRFQLLYNWEASAKYDAVRANKTSMYPAFQCELSGVPVYCLIDLSLEQHFISAGQLWKACGLTITEGLFLFELKPSDYHVDFLLPHFPFCDVWVTVPKAKRMASILGVAAELENLFQLDGIFSADLRNELAHNWKLDSIPHALYSTRALLETQCETVTRLERNEQIRTQIARKHQTGMTCKDRLETGLVRWQIQAYEEFLQQRHVDHISDDASGSDYNGGQRLSNAVWDVFQGLLFDLQSMARQPPNNNNNNSQSRISKRVLSDSMLVGNMALKREHLCQGSFLQNVYLACMAEKMYSEIQAAMKARNQEIAVTDEEAANENQRQSLISNLCLSPGQQNNAVDSLMMLHDRMDALEQEIYRMKRKGKKKAEDANVKIWELQHQFATLVAWKEQYERSRRSERIWILMISLSLVVGIWALCPHLT